MVDLGGSMVIPDPVHPSWQARFGCPVCDRKSFSLADYRGHYALAHILGLPDDPTVNTPPPEPCATMGV